MAVLCQVEKEGARDLIPAARKELKSSTNGIRFPSLASAGYAQYFFSSY